MDTTRFDGWMPIRFYMRDARPYVDWCYRGTERLAEPFFDQTVERLLRRPFNLLFRHQTPIELLGELHESSPGLRPDGFIFHMSRCGSTLVAQMLASLAQNLVVSEAAPVDSVLRAGNGEAGVPDDERAAWLRRIIGALGRTMRDDERHYFVKFDAWSIFQLPLVEKAFPGVPRIFLYREPVEVMVSQLRRRGAHMIPGVINPGLFGMDAGEVQQMSPEEYVARVLAKICEAALKHAGPHATLINYRQLPEAACTLLPALFGVEYTTDELERMRRAAESNAKNPALPFESDSDAKRDEAGERVRETAQRWVAPLYAQLESARTTASELKSGPVKTMERP